MLQIERKPVKDFSSLPGQIINVNDLYISYENNDIIKTQPKSNIHRVKNKKKFLWMKKPDFVTGCSVGLEYFANLDTIFIQQDIPTSSGENRFIIKNENGETIYRSQEILNQNISTKYGRGYGSGYVLQLFDETNQEVLRFNRPIKNNACCWCACKSCESCTHIIIVEAGDDIIGYIGQSFSLWKPHFYIADENHKKKFRIRGPMYFSGDKNDFDIYTADYGTYVGKITNHIRKKSQDNNYDTSREFPDDELNFPANLSPKNKILILAVSYLIDSIFFEVRVNEGV